MEVRSTKSGPLFFPLLKVLNECEVSLVGCPFPLCENTDGRVSNCGVIPVLSLPVDHWTIDFPLGLLLIPLMPGQFQAIV